MGTAPSKVLIYQCNVHLSPGGYAFLFMLCLPNRSPAFPVNVALKIYGFFFNFKDIIEPKLEYQITYLKVC